MKQNQIIAQGAEAILIKKGSILEKKRIKKGYRHNELDLFLRLSRTRHESKILEKAANLIPVPRIKKTTESSIEMNFIPGKKLSQFLDTFPESKALAICKQIGQNTAKIHDANIIHGDLTTSNMILAPSQKQSALKKLKHTNSSIITHNQNNPKVYFIDFGLSFHSNRPEDKAVDLHLIKEAIESKHFKRAQGYFKKIVEGYKLSPNAEVVLKQLEKVEQRGRYKGKK